MQLRAPDLDPIRVLLGPMPDLLREMIEDLLSSEADMVVLGRCDDPEAALAGACSEPADMLIVQSGAAGAGGIVEAIVEAPPFSIFAISPSGEEAAAVRFVHEPVGLDAASGTAFAAAIRRIARRGVSDSAGEARWQA